MTMSQASLRSQIHCDTLIIGAGVIGSSVAMHLGAFLHPSAGDIRVIDFDLEGGLSSSELNAGGVRGTWNQPINVSMARLTIDWFASIAEGVGYRDVGYLWLKTAESLPAALAAREIQRASGWPVEAWDLTELKRRVPFIDKTSDLAGAIFGPRDGLVNPNRVKNHLREKARASHVSFEDRSLLRDAEQNLDGSWDLWVEKFPAFLEDSDRLAVLSGAKPGCETEIVRFHARRVVNCAGPWAGGVARILGYESPAFAMRRQICIFDCRDVDLTKYGMMIDTSGVYFHSEATSGLAGFACPEEAKGINYAYDGEDFFLKFIWPALYERSSGFEKLKHLTGWAGQYEVSPDESAILGEVESKKDRLFEAHSFSGHGVMHCYAAGLALAERMVMGRYLTLDAAPLSGERFAKGQMIHETAVI